MSPPDQEKPIVSFLGPLATYSHQATIRRFPEGDWQLVPVATIKGVFDVVQAGRAAYGVVPFENSTHGVVTFTLDCLGDRAGEYADVSVCGEIYLDVHHCLLGRRHPVAAASSSSPSSPSGRARKRPADDTDEGGGAEETPTLSSSLDHIRLVYSHPQAFGQTARFTSAHLAHAELVEVSSTSRAAEMAAADTEGRSAAVASELAAAPNGLDVLARHVEDRKDNTTRFFIIRSSRRQQEQQQQPQQKQTPEPHPEKSLVSFTVPHRSPGALADALQCFRRGGLNLTSINSLPSLARPFQYLFFVEFEGGPGAGGEGKEEGLGRRGGPDNARTALLDAVRAATESSRWLGSWESQR